MKNIMMTMLALMLAVVSVQAGEPRVYNKVDVLPTFPGGSEAMISYLSSNLHYPVQAEEQGIEGRVLLAFWVERDGSIGRVTVLRSANELLDKEAVRLCRSMPRWTPARENGRAVATRYTMPVIFRLTKNVED